MILKHAYGDYLHDKVSVLDYGERYFTEDACVREKSHYKNLSDSAGVVELVDTEDLKSSDP